MSPRALRELLAKTCARRFLFWRRYALSLVGNPADADDVVQEAIARTLRARPELASEEKAHNYVLVAVRTAAYKLHRGRANLVPLEDGRPLEEREFTKAALERLLESERHHDIQRIATRLMARLDELRPACRQAIELLVLREPPMKLKEVAEVQGAPISTVHSRLKAGLRDLAEMVRQEKENAERDAGPDLGE